MKQSVAPESTSGFMSAIALLVLIETGICIDRNRVVTITELNLWTALTQADGFSRFENPLFLRGLSLLVLARLLLRLLLPSAMNQLVAVGFECLIALRLVVPLHLRMRFCHPLSLLALDSDVGSNCAVVHCCLIGSMCAGGSCDLDVPFYDMCSTQLRVGLSSFFLLGLSACFLLWVHIPLMAWLRGSFPRSLRLVRGFFLPMYPWHLGQLASSEAPTLWARRRDSASVCFQPCLYVD